jgi:hypothetical protein
MGDSAKMNIWLHKTVLARIAANGGNVPRDLLNWAGAKPRQNLEWKTGIRSDL